MLNSLMTEVPIIWESVHWFIDWFLYNRDLLYKRVNNRDLLYETVKYHGFT